MADTRDDSGTPNDCVALIMAGGGGTRLWPASTRARPKQLLSLLPSTGDDRHDSLLAATVARIEPLVRARDVHVVTTTDMVDAILDRVPALRRPQIIAEPLGRNTAPCVALAYHSVVAGLRRRGWGAARIDDAVLIILPADHHITAPARFLAALRAAVVHARAARCFVTLGVPPDHLSTAYGYIERGPEALAGDGPAFPGVRFVEKPDAERAAGYLATGRFLWNAGLFVVRLGTLRDAFLRHAPALWTALAPLADVTDAEERGRRAREAYASIEPVAFDVAIMERLPGFRVIPADVGWTDLGSWRAVHEVLPRDASDNAVAAGGRRVVVQDTRGSLVWSEDAEVAVIGLEGVAVICSGGRVLVCPLEQAQAVRDAAKAMSDGT